MRFIKQISELRLQDHFSAGGKGASLGEMLHASIPVPPGFVVLTDAFERFLCDAKLKPQIESEMAGVDDEDLLSVQKVAKTLHELIVRAEIPEEIVKEIEQAFSDLGDELVAVRSSATAEDSLTASWAGELETYLNTTQENLLQNIKKCWASLFSPRAIVYRFEKGFAQTNISVAVVIQQMVQSEVSGVAFSVHPVTKDKNQMVIEAGWGLGEAVVSGAITPDSYVVDKNECSLLDVNVSEQSTGLFRNALVGTEKQDIPMEQRNQQKLNEGQIVALAKLVKEVEDNYGFPVDVEWAMEEGEFFLLQARPVTALANRMMQPRNWEFFFRIQGAPYLIADIWLKNYRGLLCLYDGDTHIAYIRKDMVRNLLNEGYELYTNPASFDQFKKKFHLLIEDASAMLSRMEKDPVTAELWNDFVDFVRELALCYRMTEWFYTDLLYKNNASKELLHEVESLKQRGREAANQMLLYEQSESFLSRIAQSLSLPLEKIYQSDAVSIQRALETGGVDQMEFRSVYGLIWQNEHYRELPSNKVGELLYSLEAIQKDEGAAIKGTTTNAGIVRGIVTLIPNIYDDIRLLYRMIEEMPKGHVLVSSTTSPEFTAAIRKASAIITDEGGLGSHAAIVSREFDIPCIVGTKNATKLLKNGDEVEVDANTGTVTILS